MVKVICNPTNLELLLVCRSEQGHEVSTSCKFSNIEDLNSAFFIVRQAIDLK